MNVPSAPILAQPFPERSYDAAMRLLVAPDGRHALAGAGLGALGAGRAVALVAMGGIGWASSAQAQAVNCTPAPYM